MSDKNKNLTKEEFLSVRIPVNTKAKLQKIADQEERSLSWVVGKIIDDYLKKQGKRLK